MNEACRLCLRIPEECYYFMNKYLNEIKLILPELDVSLTKDPIICSKCLDNLLTSATFKTICIKCDEELKKKINQAEQYNQESYEDDQHIILTIQADNKINDLQKVEQIKIVDANPTKCEPDADFDLKLTCKICFKEFSSRKLLTEHKKCKHTNYACNLCNVKFLYKAALHKHLRRHAGVNGDQKYYECNICGVRKRLKYQLTEHMRVHTGERPYKCKHCSKSFSQSSTLTTHVRSMHLDEKPFICEVCARRFPVRGQFTYHMRIAHSTNKEYNFVCSFCGKAFLIQSKLEQHLRKHTGEKPYFCHMCSRRFAQKSDLNRHLLTHSGERRYECLWCKKRFGRKGNRDTHYKSCRKKCIDSDRSPSICQ